MTQSDFIECDFCGTVEDVQVNVFCGVEFANCKNCINVELINELSSENIAMLRERAKSEY